LILLYFTLKGKPTHGIFHGTVLEWLKLYSDSNGNLDSLYPKNREDRGTFRSIDFDTQQALLAIKKELGRVPLPVLLKKALERGLINSDFKASKQTIYRLFEQNGLNTLQQPATDRRKYEAELPNDIWQSDCMHGPLVSVDGKKRKSFLFAFIDDHSRLIPHAQFYLCENLACYLDCLKIALKKRGLPRKLYVDNGPSFRAHHLKHVLAGLGIALIHAKPYCPEGKGKQERWFRTVRSSFLTLQPPGMSLADLNAALTGWITHHYHASVHSGTNELPLDRYLKHIHLIRPAPADLDSHFRVRTQRRVYKDRTVFLEGRVYEAPLSVIEKQVTLLYSKDDPNRVEVFFNDSSYGFLTPLDVHINSRIKRANDHAEIAPKDNKSPDQPHNPASYQSGELF
jgi:transposase InsO family protein